MLRRSFVRGNTITTSGFSRRLVGSFDTFTNLTSPIPLAYRSLSSSTPPPPRSLSSSSWPSSSFVRDPIRYLQSSLIKPKRERIWYKIRLQPSKIDKVSTFLWYATHHGLFKQKGDLKPISGVVLELTEELGSVAALISALDWAHVPAKTLLYLVKIYASAECLPRADETLAILVDYPSTYSVTYPINVVMDLHFKCSDVIGAMSLFRRIETPNFLSYSIAINNLCHLRCMDDRLILVLRLMLKSGFIPDKDAWFLLAARYAEVGGFSEVKQLYTLMIYLGFPLYKSLWLYLAEACRRRGDVEEACRIFGWMVECGYSTNRLTSIAVVGSCYEAKMPAKASWALDVMRARGRRSEQEICNVLFCAFPKNSKYKDAIATFQHLRKLNYHPDSVILRIMFSIACLTQDNYCKPLLALRDGDLRVDVPLISFLWKCGANNFAYEAYSVLVVEGRLRSSFAIGSFTMAKSIIDLEIYLQRVAAQIEENENIEV